MISHQQKSIRVLLVDSVHSYRQFLVKIFRDVGITNTVGVGSADEAIDCVSHQFFDVIISEYDLEQGKNGIQFLEALRAKQILPPETVFIFLSAETSKSIVVSAYDLEPDAYLTKPINAKECLERVTRLLSLKAKLKKVYQIAGDLYYKHPLLPKEKNRNEMGTAIDFLSAMLLTVDNPASKLRNTCQKMLGRAYLRAGDFQSAEEVYRQVLEVMPVDWAKVGMAIIKKEKDNTDEAIKDLENIIKAYPLCLEAYDQLIDIHSSKHDKESHKEILFQSAQLSPLSILRQEQLGLVSFNLSDYKLSTVAFQATVKLGRFSVYDKFSNYVDFGRAANLYVQEAPDENRVLLQDAIKALGAADERFELSEEELAQLALVKSQSYAVQRNNELTQESILLASQRLEGLDDKKQIETDIDIILLNRLNIGENLFSNQDTIEEITSKYKNNELALEKIDKFLDEPISQANKEYIGRINKEGIHFYEKKQFQESITCFERAIKSFPKYVPLHLNLVQALYGYCENGCSEKKAVKESSITTSITTSVAKKVDTNAAKNVAMREENDEDVASVMTHRAQKKKSFDRANSILSFIKNEINESHQEYKRYIQLQEMIADIAPSFNEH
ncbi:MAG: response regulator [Cellvibrionaceae bacterium]